MSNSRMATSIRTKASRLRRLKNSATHPASVRSTGRTLGASTRTPSYQSLRKRREPPARHRPDRALGRRLDGRAQILSSQRCRYHRGVGERLGKHRKLSQGEKAMMASTSAAWQRVKHRCVWVGECFVWQGAVQEKGYGMIRVAGRLQKVHRV